MVKIKGFLRVEFWVRIFSSCQSYEISSVVISSLGLRILRFKDVK